MELKYPASCPAWEDISKMSIHKQVSSNNRIKLLKRKFMKAEGQQVSRIGQY